MNDTTIVNQSLSEPTRKAKLCSWKWWVYGDIYPQPSEKTPWYFTLMVVTYVTIWLVFFLHPWMTSLVRRTTPDMSTLQAVHGLVIDTRGRATHLSSQADDGSHLTEMRPIFRIDLKSAAGGEKNLVPANPSINECEAMVWLDKPRHALPETYRIWKIHCDDSSEGASLDEFLADAALETWLIWTGLMGFLVIPFIGIVYFGRTKIYLTKKISTSVNKGFQKSRLGIFMNSEAINAKCPSKPPLWQRLFSWRWWFFGDVNFQMPEKLPKGFLNQLCLAVVIWLFMFVQPWIATFLNRHPPEFSKLKGAQGMVISTTLNTPHLVLRLNNGEVLKMEYPHFMNNIGRSYAVGMKLGRNNEKVLGCHATVWYDVPRYTLWTRYRVWQIYCDDRHEGASYTKIINTAGNFGLVLMGSGAFFTVPFLMLMALGRFIKERQ